MQLPTDLRFMDTVHAAVERVPVGTLASARKRFIGQRGAANRQTPEPDSPEVPFEETSPPRAGRPVIRSPPTAPKNRDVLYWVIMKAVNGVS